MIGGEVDAIAAVYTRLARGADGAWGPVRGSSSLEPVTTTSETRRPTRRIRWESAASRSAAGGMRGRQELRDGDEQHWGWRFVLVDAHVEDRPDGDQAGADLR